MPSQRCTGAPSVQAAAVGPELIRPAAVAQGDAAYGYAIHPGTAGMRFLTAALTDHYAGQRFIEVAQGSGARIVPTDLNNTNRLRITVQGDAQNGCATVVAVLDNLGKGASGAAVQNLNIMLGVDEGLSL